MYKGTSLRVARAPWHDNLCGDPFGHVGGTWAAQCWSFQHCIFSEEVYYQRGLQCFLWRLSMVVGARHRYVIEYVSLLTTISHTATSHCHNITHCHSVFLPRSAIRQHVYCKSDMRWRLSTRCGQTTAYSTAASTSSHCTAQHCFALHCFLSSSSHRLPRHPLQCKCIYRVE